MNRIFIIILTLPAMAFGQDFVEPCKKVGAPMPLEMTNSQCTQAPCSVPNGAYVEANVTFIATFSAQNLKYRTDGYLGDFKIPVEFVPPELEDACPWLISENCPIIQNQVYSHTITLPVNAPYNDVTIAMENYITGDNIPIFCYRNIVTVTKP